MDRRARRGCAADRAGTASGPPRRASAIVPGSIHRASLTMTATYVVTATLDVDTGACT